MKCEGYEAEVLAKKEYEEYEGYFITSAMLADDVKLFAEENDIEVMDGTALVELIVNNLDKLSETTKRPSLATPVL